MASTAAVMAAFASGCQAAQAGNGFRRALCGDASADRRPARHSTSPAVRGATRRHARSSPSASPASARGPLRGVNRNLHRIDRNRPRWRVRRCAATRETLPATRRRCPASAPPPEGSQSSATDMRFSVSVPVLSVHRTVADPSVSMAAARRVSTPDPADPPGAHRHEHGQHDRKFLRQHRHADGDAGQHGFDPAAAQQAVEQPRPAGPPRRRPAHTRTTTRRVCACRRGASVSSVASD